MAYHRRTCWLALVGLLGSGATNADLTSDLADLSARAEYGFYTADLAVIEAARIDLDRLAAADARVSYYRALAAMRSAQVKAGLASSAGQAFGECIESAERAVGQAPSWAEAWVLIAACSTLAANAEPRNASSHERRFEAAVATARSLDSDNARLALVEVWYAARDLPRLEVAAVDVLVAMLEAVLVSFEAESPGPLTPGWGEAESLALLSTLHLERGATQAARDAAERALLAAPGYAYAAELMTRIEGHAGAPSSERR